MNQARNPKNWLNNRNTKDLVYTFQQKIRFFDILAGIYWALHETNKKSRQMEKLPNIYICK